MGSKFQKGDAVQAQTPFPFEPIPAYTDGTVHIPAGYKWDVLVRWGDPLTPEAEGHWNSETGGSVEMSDKVFDENTDGMELFNIGGREIFCVNSEYTNREENLPPAPEGAPQSADDVLKLQNLQGVNIPRTPPPTRHKDGGSTARPPKTPLSTSQPPGR
jgi:Predicted phosphatase